MTAFRGTRAWRALSIGLVILMLVACEGSDGGAPGGGDAGEGASPSERGGSAGTAGSDATGEGGAARTGEGGADSDPDKNDDYVADDLGNVVDTNADAVADPIDINHDGKPDGVGIDTNDDGVADALALDPDCDGFYEACDTDGDGKPNYWSTLKPVGDTTGCNLPEL